MSLAVREATAQIRAAWAAFVAARPEGDVLQAWAWGEAGADDLASTGADSSSPTPGTGCAASPRSWTGRLLRAHHPLRAPRPPGSARRPTPGEILAHLIDGLRAHARARGAASSSGFDPRSLRGAAACRGAVPGSPRWWRAPESDTICSRRRHADRGFGRRGRSGVRLGQGGARRAAPRGARGQRCPCRSPGRTGGAGRLPRAACGDVRAGRLPHPLAGLPGRPGRAAGGRRRLVPGHRGARWTTAGGCRGAAHR